MFYYIYELLNFNIFQYITVRAGFSFFIAFCLTVWALPKFIAWAKAKNAAQPIYELAPQTHQKKAKTPTMGGLVFIGAALVASVICARLDNVFRRQKPRRTKPQSQACGTNFDRLCSFFDAIF